MSPSTVSWVVTDCLRFSAVVPLFTLLGIAGAVTLPGQDELDSWSGGVIQQAAERIGPAVVQIETVGGTAAHPLIPPGRPSTGTIVDREGHIVTAAVNLLHEPEAIMVRLADGQRLNARIVGRNHSRQVVLLKIDAAPDVKFGETAAVVGQTAIAVGKSRDPVHPELSSGIVSATGRVRGRAVQTDAAVSPLNYGGPLVDLEGRVLGILVPLVAAGEDPVSRVGWYDSGIGFAVPVADLRIPDMVAGGELHSGWSGISFRESAGLASPAVVAAIEGDSPAGQAGIEPGDRVTAANGQPVELLAGLRQISGPLYAGDILSLTLDRKGQVIERQLKLREHR